MLQVTQKIDVICSAIGIKETIAIVPLMDILRNAIENHDCMISITNDEAVRYAKVLNELGFVDSNGNNLGDAIKLYESDIQE